MLGGGAFSSGGSGAAAGGGDEGGASLSGFVQTRLGIDRAAVDGVSAVVPLLTEGIFENRVWQRLRSARPHPVWGRQLLPPHNLPPWSGAAVCPFLACSFMNRTRTACTRLKWFPHGQKLLAGTQPGELAVWSGTFFGFEDLKRLPQGGGAITALEWSGGGDRLFVGDASGLVVVLSQALNPIENEPLKGLSHPVLSLSASPLTAQLLAGCADTADPLIWDVNRLAVSRVLRAPNLDSASSTCLQWHPVSALVATGCKSSWVYLWDPRDAAPVAMLQPHRGAINKVVFHPNGSLLLTCSRDTLVRSIDLRMFRPLHLFRLPRSPAPASASLLPPAEPLQLALNPVHPNVFVTGDNQGRLSFFSLLQPSAPLLQLQEAHGTVGPWAPGERVPEGAVVSLDWHPMGNLLVSASDGRLMRFWARGVGGGVAGASMQTVKLVDFQSGGITGDFPVSARRVRDREVVDKRKKARLLATGGLLPLGAHVQHDGLDGSDGGGETGLRSRGTVAHTEDRQVAGNAEASGHRGGGEESDEEEDWGGWMESGRGKPRGLPRIRTRWLVGRHGPAGR
ncbi:WD domain, G-beta repeat-containing protein [Toxoplasma gondii TgCatPRC2]|uniref:WD domain, G-beta repeat-containing protein n=7 Tax=Toxoplasma gondii TaxID=5811 RepID=A0A151HN57_TOXGO|nr:WD domain, G-beta repeat-containing protein [Toxoplasma gondii ME49]KFG39118.1 WD domain, G-beta repeat-containing protein [Toxoplasma gondii GAB2-2007-GAL-DOM2]KYK70805.1 WD domain, G-beta repeat-containing protein [Toxoplasma gondii TgCatPRC2]PIM00956.1 WD domain, G-beta repeat-containing protein [Toxoplasma gondii COUG]RQX75043.1 WD domain, G-beta repeat-containing protein [Toxoplasma gondii CAST]EPT28226.1 WD domain, G-beta repeat-containing protein [Toxoplasma gondii ME49]|eukprot:XP_002365532.1 WD domain, G-beta repeat-containing protein [Toxoplasma gondii ME49]